MDNVSLSHSVCYCVRWTPNIPPAIKCYAFLFMCWYKDQCARIVSCSYYHFKINLLTSLLLYYCWSFWSNNYNLQLRIDVLIQRNRSCFLEYLPEYFSGPLTWFCFRPGVTKSKRNTEYPVKIDGFV